MKKLLLIIFVVGLVNIFKSQVVFSPPGAEWRHIFRDGFSPGHKANISYVRDSVVDNESVKVLKYNYFYKYSSGNYCRVVLIHQSGDTIFMRNCLTSNTWQILYNFAATPGQKWITTVKDTGFENLSYSPITHTITVNAVTTVTINNLFLKKLQVTYSAIGISGTLENYDADIIERIGCTTYLFNYLNHPDIEPSALIDYLCYKDNAFGVKEFSSKGCEYAVGIKENYGLFKDLIISPNPAGEKLYVKTGALPDKLSMEILNTLGQTVIPAVNVKNGQELDVSHLNTGVYYMKLKNAEGYKVIKLVKE